MSENIAERDRFWNIGVAFAKEKKWSDAIENYEKALEYGVHPFLYTNLAECHKHLDHLDKYDLYYEISIPLLLELTNRHTLNPYNNCAWYLFKKNRFEDALIFSLIAIYGKTMDKNKIHTHASILNALEKKDEALPYLLKLRNLTKFTDEYKEFLDNFEQDILNYQSKIFENETKESVAESILKNKQVSQNIINKVIYNSGKTNDYFYYWKHVLDELIEKGFDIDDKILLNIYEYAISKNYQYEIFNFLISVFGDSEESFESIISLLKLTSIDEADILMKLVESYSYKLELTSFFKDKLLPKHDKAILKRIGTQWGSAKAFFVKMLLEYNENYESQIVKKLKNISYSEGLNDVISLFKNESNFKEVFFYKLDSWFNSRVQKNSVPTLMNTVHEYFDGATDDLSLINKTCNPRVNDNYYAAYYLLQGLKPNSEWSITDRLYQFFITIDLNGTINAINNTTGLSFNDFKDRFNVSVKQLAEYYTNKIGGYYYADSKSIEELKKILLENFDETVLGINNCEAKYIAKVIEHVYLTDSEKAYPKLMDWVGASSKPIRVAASKYLGKYKEAFDEIKNLLNNKKGSVREMGVEILSQMEEREDDVKELLDNLYKTEKTQGVKKKIDEFYELCKERAIARRLLLIETFTKEDFIEDIKNQEFSFDFNLDSISGLKWENSEILDSKTSLYFLNLLSQNFGDSLENIHKEAEKISSLMNKESLSILAKELFILSSENENSQFWYFKPALYWGDESLFQLVKTKLETVIDPVLMKLAVKLGGYVGFQLVKNIAIRMEGTSTSSQAWSVINQAQTMLNLTTEEFNDWSIPDFGFSSDGVLELDYGPRFFSVKLNPDFSFILKDQTGKEIKSLPKPSKKDDETKSNESSEFFKKIKAQLKDIVKEQKTRLENSMISSRKWSGVSWEIFFSKHPVMKRFAIGLIWGVYDENSQLIDTFRFMEDGTFNNKDDDSFEFDNSKKIGIVHPIELNSEDIDLWKTQLEDYEIAQPFKQMLRDKIILTSELEDKTEISDFKGYMVIRISLKSKLYDRNWTYGSVEDAGVYYYYRKHYSDGIEARVYFLGDYAGGCDKFAPTPLKELVFYKNGSQVTLKEIPQMILSEAYKDVKEVASSGSGYNESWETLTW
ncbi:DUF4132 domain-containing protein [bacterium]|nr:DUF4132 domain-containing protein [bacterium]